MGIGTLVDHNCYQLGEQVSRFQQRIRVAQAAFPLLTFKGFWPELSPFPMEFEQQRYLHLAELLFLLQLSLCLQK